MCVLHISGKQLRDAVISGANNIIIEKNKVDELNIFPVPDGDTGTNMSMTIRNALASLAQLDNGVSVSKVAETTASCMLKGARGNSGVILSLLFRGFAKGLSGCETASGADIAKSLTLGVEAAYKSVMKPTEGTILTVSREAAEAAVKKAEETDDALAVFEALIAEGDASLERTPDLLPALKKAGVVDSGAMGFLVIMKGMYRVLSGGGIIAANEETAVPVSVVNSSTNAAGTYETDIVFTYCTEFIVKKKEGAKDSASLRAYLESIGDSVVVVDDDSIIKVHVHTDHPGNAFEQGLLFGSLINMKVENMREQHQAQVDKVNSVKKNNSRPYSPKRNTALFPSQQAQVLRLFSKTSVLIR